MFFDPARIVHMRQMILATNEAARREALDKLLPYQREDFLQLFKIMAGLPVTIRLLDPPLNEFLPHSLEEMEEVAKAAGADVFAWKSDAGEVVETLAGEAEATGSWLQTAT